MSAVEVIENQEEMREITIEMLIAGIERIDDLHTLSTIMKIAATRMEKATKSGKSNKKLAVGGRAVPSQLQKPKAWTEFVLAHCNANGWESFEMTTKKKDGTEIVEMSESGETEDGKHVFATTAKAFTLQHAMVYSKILKENNDPIYAEFEAQYVPSEASAKASTAVKAKTVRMTAEEKEAEKDRKKAEKEAEKERKQAERKAESERKKAEKEAEKKAEKERKEAEKAAEKASKVPAKAVLLVPRKASPSPKPAVAEPVAAAVVKTVLATPMARAVVKKPVVEEWTVKKGTAKPWEWKGTKYIRNSENEVWLNSKGGYGDWCGVYIVGEDRIDETAVEPEEDDE